MERRAVADVGVPVAEDAFADRARAVFGAQEHLVERVGEDLARAHEAVAPRLVAAERVVKLRDPLSTRTPRLPGAAAASDSASATASVRQMVMPVAVSGCEQPAASPRSATPGDRALVGS